MGRKMRDSNLEKAPPLDESLKKELNLIFREDIQKLEGLIDRDLSNWISK